MFRPLPSRRRSLFRRLIGPAPQVALLAAALLAPLAAPSSAQVTVIPNITSPRDSIILDGSTSRGQILRQLRSGTVMAPETNIRMPCSQRPCGPRPTPPVHQEASLIMPVRFAYDSAELNSHARAILDEVAAAMLDPSMRGARFLIEGHTDAVGSLAYNQTLSERRARAAQSYLIRRGVPASALVVVGYSWQRPLPHLSPRDPEQRRVEIGRLRIGR